MGTQKHTLREPDTDLAINDHWKFQLRDSHGRWTVGRGSDPSQAVAMGRRTFGPQFKRVESHRTLPPPNAEPFSETTKTVHYRSEARVLERGEVRESLSLDHTSRERMFIAAGLKTHYKMSETELIHAWHETSNPSEKAKLEKEMEVRQKCLEVALTTVKEASVLAAREQKRSALRKFDDHLAGSRMGKALLKIRDKIIADKAFDRAEKVSEAVKEYGKDWAKHLATSTLTKTLIGSAVALAVAHLGGGSSPEAIKSVLENPLAEAGIAAAAGLAIGLGAKVLHRGSKKAVQTVKVKAKTHETRAQKKARQQAALAKYTLKKA